MSSGEKESTFRLWYIVQSRVGPANEDFGENLHRYKMYLLLEDDNGPIMCLY